MVRRRPLRVHTINRNYAKFSRRYWRGSREHPIIVRDRLSPILYRDVPDVYYHPALSVRKRYVPVHGSRVRWPVAVSESLGARWKDETPWNANRRRVVRRLRRRPYRVIRSFD